MRRKSMLSIPRRLLILLAAAVVLSTAASAQAAKAEGIIKVRNGDTMVLQSAGGPDVVVLLTDSTEVGQVQGMLKARRKQMSMAALIPGLAVKVEGTYDTQNQLVAKKVSFKGDDLQQAQKIEAGMHEVKVQNQQQQEQLDKQQAELQAHNEALQEQQKKIVENKAAIDAAVARFGQLDDYYILDEVTVLFGNGKTKVDPKYAPQLLALAEKAKTINGYMIEVKGYASSSGSVGLNQKLSEDRAANVTNVLLQQGHVPLTRMLAPGAMGESQQTGSEKGADSEAENRRVVVRVLQSKGIAGI